MLKPYTIYFIPILFFISFETGLISGSTPKKPVEDIRCSTSYDCFDIRMICSKTNKTCTCAHFHDWDYYAESCIANISKIIDWFRGTMSTEPETVFHQDFARVKVGNITVLQTKWTEYEGEKETGIGHVIKIIWPIILGSALILFVYGAILLEFL